mmetsp:Transcript_141508/g.451973  ORF Transcript_141508/g.451973 Transcript_141508/m.451973 type:complete len:237 (+) Transcript_141508:830-1540(+)
MRGARHHPHGLPISRLLRHENAQARMRCHSGLDGRNLDTAREVLEAGCVVDQGGRDILGPRNLTDIRQHPLHRLHLALERLDATLNTIHRRSQHHDGRLRGDTGLGLHLDVRDLAKRLAVRSHQGVEDVGSILRLLDLQLDIHSLPRDNFWDLDDGADDHGASDQAQCSACRPCNGAIVAQDPLHSPAGNDVSILTLRTTNDSAAEHLDECDLVQVAIAERIEAGALATEISEQAS